MGGILIDGCGTVEEAEKSKNTVSGTENALRQDAPIDGATCPKCKTVLQDNASFCWNCGCKINEISNGVARNTACKEDNHEKDCNVTFSLLINDVMTISGVGTVAFGAIDQGEIHIGDTVEIVDSSSRKKTSVVNAILLVQNNQRVHSATKGDHVGLALEISRFEVERGQTIYKRGPSQRQKDTRNEEMKTTDDAVLTNASAAIVDEETKLTEPIPLVDTTELDSSFNNKRRAFSSPINLLPERKVCPKCNLLYVGTKEKCSICGCDLVEKKDG